MTPPDDTLKRLEDWIQVKGYEGRYWVSRSGWVMGRRKILSPSHPKGKYPMLNLYKNGTYKTVRVHQLILETFVGPRPKGMEACHLDGNPANNALTNLRWDTDKVNTSHRKIHGRDTIGERHGSAKLTDAKVRIIRELNLSGLPWSEIADHYGVCESTIRNIIKRKTWRHVPALSDLAKIEGGE